MTLYENEISSATSRVRIGLALKGLKVDTPRHPLPESKRSWIWKLSKGEPILAEKEKFP
jgi:hypothetical protein